MSDHSKPLQEEAPASDTIPSKPAKRLLERFLGASPLLLGAVSVTCAILLAAGVVFVGIPWVENRQASEKLASLVGTSGPVTPLNTTLVTFKGQEVENANVEQKALGKGTTATTPATFIFTNGKGAPPKTLSLYLDLTSPSSRDFLLLNRSMLQGLVEGGLVELRISLVPTGEASSVYFAEALAEAFYTSPQEAWGFLFEGVKSMASSKAVAKEAIAKELEETAKKSGVKDVDAASIQNGTFASWLLTVGDDPRLAAGFYPPLVYVDSKLLDSKTVNLNDPDEVRKEVLGK